MPAEVGTAHAPPGGEGVFGKILDATHPLFERFFEKLDERFASYVDEVVDAMRDGADAGRAKAFLDIVAGFVGMIRDNKAAQIVRRRAAAA